MQFTKALEQGKVLDLETEYERTARAWVTDHVLAQLPEKVAPQPAAKKPRAKA